MAMLLTSIAKETWLTCINNFKKSLGPKADRIKGNEKLTKRTLVAFQLAVNLMEKSIEMEKPRFQPDIF